MPDTVLTFCHEEAGKDIRVAFVGKGYASN